MLFFLIASISFLVLLLKSLLLQSLPSWAIEMRLLSLLFYKESLYILLQWLRNSKTVATAFLTNSSTMSTKKKVAPKSVEVDELKEEKSVLDLPDLVLECILSRLPPTGLYNMMGVCRSMRGMCRSDHLWEAHMSEKWNRITSPAMHREWQRYVASMNGSSGISSGKFTGVIGSLSCMWPISWLRCKLEGAKKLSSFPGDSIMSLYLSLEGGKFWFPAQVYNRENGHMGFMLSCYDAEISYNRNTNTFQARYPPHGRRTVVVEEGVQWDRVRAPPVETSAHDLHISDCLIDLRPGEHIEIQWRRNKEFPYGWWYGVVGHLETCDGTELHCRCHRSDIVILEFNQYATGSRWRRTAINRKDHREEGNETDGFYGGIRRLQRKEEISMWRKLWPTDILE